MQWLKHEKNGTIWPYTEELAKRRDMRLVGEAEQEHGRVAGRQAVEDDAAADEAPAITGGLPTAAQVHAMTDKGEIEDLANQFGIEIDKRKALKTLQAELIESLGLDQ